MLAVQATGLMLWQPSARSARLAGSPEKEPVTALTVLRGGLQMQPVRKSAMRAMLGSTRRLKSRLDVSAATLARLLSPAPLAALTALPESMLRLEPRNVTIAQQARTRIVSVLERVQSVALARLPLKARLAALTAPLGHTLRRLNLPGG